MIRIVIIILLINQYSFGQLINVLDIENKTKIEYANVIFFKNNHFVYGDYTDSNGSLLNQTNIEFDTIQISCIGYKTRKIDKYFMKRLPTIYLEKESILLEEIVVSNLKNSIVGTLDKKKIKSIGLSNGIEIATYLQNDLKMEVSLKSVLFKVEKVKKESKYRIHFYEYDINSKTPSKEIIHKNEIFILNKGDKGIIKVDISEYNIKFPQNGLYVSIEGIDGNLDKNKSLFDKKNNFFIEAYKSSSEIFVTRNYINNVGWINWNNWLPKNYKDTFNKDYDKNKLFVPSIALEIY